MKSALALAGLLLLPVTAEAFCGFYVGSGDAELFANATQVALMREGNRTVLSMANNYRGPAEDFAMVVPVPVVLQEEDVKTLPAALFDRLDALAAPRLVEYWEQDPCNPWRYQSDDMLEVQTTSVSRRARRSGRNLGVTVEAQFTVGEYEIVILSASDSAGLDTWLNREGYRIPDGAEPVLRPYVQSGSKFFVARVDIEKVAYDESGHTMLSPLRFHYDTPRFTLPVRLGLLNAQGPQDLIVHVLARGQRYEVANRPNATIPTNFDVAEGARDQFGGFYTALFDRTLEHNPGAVITEYSWDASTCDPCPTPALTGSELMSLGMDTVGNQNPRGFVLTRLHARYTAEELTEDLVFRAAPPIAGGREVRDAEGTLEHGSVSAGRNNFQGRYAIRHAWEGPIECESPQRGIWGGPPDGGQPPSASITDAGLVPRGGVALGTLVLGAVPEIDLAPGESAPAGAGDGVGSTAPAASPEAPATPDGTTASNAAEDDIDDIKACAQVQSRRPLGALAVLGLLGLGLFGRRER